MQEIKTKLQMKKTLETEICIDAGGNPYLGFIVDDEILEEDLDLLESILGEKKFHQYNENLLIRNNYRYHLTIVAPHEWRILNLDECHFSGKEYEVNFLGLGGVKKFKDEVFFSVCECPDIQHLRSGLGLNNRDLHVTLGFKRQDFYDVSKDRTTLIKQDE